MNILFIGDIVGSPGRRSVAKWLPTLLAEQPVDFVVANGENSAGGLGATPETLAELRKLGVQAFTLGNHTWRQKAMVKSIETVPDVVRPVNYPEGVPGQGYRIIENAAGKRLGLVNVLGRVFMDALDCPFVAVDKALKALRDQCDVILVDVHAEATSEKVAMGWHLDGRCAAVLGTHTHVQTADEWILPQGTAYITDVGMCGPLHSVIGVKTEIILRKFTTGLPERFETAHGPLLFNAVRIEVDDRKRCATKIERVFYRE